MKANNKKAKYLFIPVCPIVLDSILPKGWNHWLFYSHSSKPFSLDINGRGRVKLINKRESGVMVRLSK